MDKKFIIFGRSTCPFCAMAEDLLLCHSIPFTFLDYSTQPKILEDYKEFYKQKTVPIILSNNLVTGKTYKVGGYTDLLDYLKVE